HSNPMFRTSIHTLSLHDALPIYVTRSVVEVMNSLATTVVNHALSQPQLRHHVGTTRSALANNSACTMATTLRLPDPFDAARTTRSEEHTSELQSLRHLVCRLLLE